MCNSSISSFLSWVDKLRALVIREVQTVGAPAWNSMQLGFLARFQVAVF